MEQGSELYFGIMKAEAQRIAIAEACGWKQVRVAFDKKSGDQWPVYQRGEQIGSIYTETLPDYLNDLNAMHAAESRISFNEEDHYSAILWDIVKRDKNGIRTVWHATAAQRAEAFLKTKNLWRP